MPERQRKLKIAVINYSSSGLFHYACCLVSALAEQSNTEILFLTSSHNNQALLPRGSNVRVLTQAAPHQQAGFWRWLLNLREQQLIYQTIKHFQPDVIHLTDSHAVYVPHAWWLRRYPIVFTQHDPLMHPGDVYPLASRIIHATQQRLARRIIVHGQFLKKTLVARGLDPVRISVILHGDYSFLLRWRDATISPIPNSVLFFGRIAAYKGLDILLESLIQLQTGGVAPVLILAGAGDLGPYQSLLEKVRNKIIDNRTIPEEEIIHYFQRATLIALPYREASQSGIISIAMPAETPIVATTVGALPEILVHRQNSLLVPPNNPIALAASLREVLEKPALRVQLVHGARETVATKLTWPRIAVQYRQVYQAVL